MTKRVAVVVSLFAVALVGVLVWAILTMNELSETRDTLSSTKVELAMTIAELEETKDKLVVTTNELTSTKSELSSTKSELTNTKNELTDTKNELTRTKSELSSTKSELISAQQASANLQVTLSSTQQQLAVARETLRGLGITLLASNECYDIALVDNPGATNPTLAQLMTFLSQDQTEMHTYIEDVYDCSQFSMDVHNNAEAAGIRAAEVHVEWSDETTGHALNAFLTTDYGLVYIDCTGEPDKVARVEAGKVLRAVELYRIAVANIRNDYWWDTLSSYYYIASSTGGEAVASSIIIYW